MIQFKQIFEDGKETITYYTSKAKFWGFYNQSTDYEGYPTRFDSPEGDLIYVYNHKRKADRKKPIRFNMVDWEGTSSQEYFDNEDDFWDHFLQLGFDIMPKETSHGGKTSFYLNLQSNVFA